ncbi:MAG: DUF6448 family protein [Rubrivivax sp.]|nr:DUF6448 family protein [Rubrivivax sp.]
MLTVNRNTFRRYLTLVAGAVALSWGAAAQAHCDTLDGPVVTDARKALDTGNVNMVLGWVQKKDEAEIRDAFQKSASVRKSGTPGKELADRYFFETLVRVHRAGEGAAYTGLKPAGEIEPAIAAADRSIETGKLEPVARLVKEEMEHGLHKQFEAVASKKKFNANDVEAARAFVGAYVEYVHYVEALYKAAGPAKPEHAGHAPAAATAAAKPTGHPH